MLSLKYCFIFVNFLVIAEVSGSEESVFDFFMFENFELTRKVFLNESQLVKTILDTKQRLQTRAKDIKVTLEKIHTAKNDYQDILSALAILKRCYIYIKPLMRNYKKDVLANNETFHNVTKLMENFPTTDDWDGSRKALFLLHDTYEFNLTEAAMGNLVYKNADNQIQVLKGREGLTAHDLGELGSFGLQVMNYYDRAVEFIREALKLSDDTLNKEELQAMREMGKYAAKYNNKALKQKQVTNGKTYKVAPYLFDEKTLKKKSKQPKLEFNSKIGTFNWLEDLSKDQFFRRVCQRGTIFRGEEKKFPRCRFQHYFNPFLKLGPFKMEIVSDDPFVVIFPQFFSEEEIQWLLDYSTPRLSRNRPDEQFNSGPKYKFTDGKKTKIVHKTVQTWIEDIEYHETDMYDFSPKKIALPNMFKISQRLGLAGNFEILKRHSTTSFQTTNYGLGGICEIHIDPHGYLENIEVPDPEGNQLNGDILATFMGWLTDTDAGGGTAFAIAGKEVLIMPRRGAVAFWYSRDAKGFRLQESSHGGCPVLKGSKWIINKWIMYFNQFKNFPCSLDPFARFPQPRGFYSNMQVSPNMNEKM